MTFKKIIAFTDIHFGNKGNSTQFNEDCTDFINWMCATAVKQGCETCVFLGDWHHHRNTINVSTLNYTTRNLKKLNDSFEKVYFITGNHDLYYREKREIHSLPMLTEFSNIIAIDHIMSDGDITFVPWLVEDEWKKIKNIKSRYVFGHFEIPGFKLNAQIEMPDHGEINKTHFKNVEYVFSGHFHRRQIDKNIHYIGNPFGHDYSTSWDFDHGCMILPYGEDPQYINWTDGPRYITLKLSDLLSDTSVLTNKTYVKCEQDVDMTFEEATELKETLSSTFGVREFKLTQPKSITTSEVELDISSFQTIDEIFNAEINNIDSNTFNTNTLLTIYNDL